MVDRKQLNAAIFKPLIIDGIGTLIVVLGLYSFFVEPLHPLLESRSILVLLFVVGGVMMVWGFGQFFFALRRQQSNG